MNRVKPLTFIFRLNSFILVIREYHYIKAKITEPNFQVGLMIPSARKLWTLLDLMDLGILQRLGYNLIDIILANLSALLAIKLSRKEEDSRNSAVRSEIIFSSKIGGSE
jgi:hypothetical protein